MFLKKKKKLTVVTYSCRLFSSLLPWVFLKSLLVTYCHPSWV